TKIDGLPADVLAKALQQARAARMQILDVMNKALAEPRPTVAATAPKIVSFEIPLDKIGEVIGPKGKIINTMQQETGADIKVEDVLNLGDEITVRVDDIDPQGKVSLTPVGDGDQSSDGGASGGDAVPAAVSSSGEAATSGEPTREYASFEETFEGEAKEKFGD